MRGTTPADVAAERQLTVVERLHVLLPRSRGFRGSADGSVGVYPASSHARHLPAARQEGSPRSKREPRSGRRRASVLRTHAPAAALRAAKHAERREQTELRLQQLTRKMATGDGRRATTMAGATGQGCVGEEEEQEEGRGSPPHGCGEASVG